jgi:hypothetical protein
MSLATLVSNSTRSGVAPHLLSHTVEWHPIFYHTLRGDNTHSLTHCGVTFHILSYTVERRSASVEMMDTVVKHGRRWSPHCQPLLECPVAKMVTKQINLSSLLLSLSPNSKRWPNQILFSASRIVYSLNTEQCHNYCHNKDVNFFEKYRWNRYCKKYVKQLTKLKFWSCLKVQIRFHKFTFALTEIFSFDYSEKQYMK